MDSNKCLNGNSTQPCQHNCNGQWLYKNCSATCPLRTTCQDCLAFENQDGCSWCEDRQQCFEPSAQSPPACNCLWKDATTCGACAAHAQCSSCTGDTTNRCGWCLGGGDMFGEPEAGPGTCLPSSSANLPCTTDVCPNLQRNWLVHTCDVNCTMFSGSCGECLAQVASGCAWCPGVPNGQCLFSNQLFKCPTQGCLQTTTCANCSLHTRCGDCVADPACGWCATSQTCLAGSKTGPCAGGTCAGLWNKDTCAGACVYPTCETCTAQSQTDPFCRWCSASQMCGPASFFTNGTCPGCVLQTCPAVGLNCSKHSDCASCTASAACGWCPTTSKCLFGNEDGPCDNQMCPGWSFVNCDGECMQNTECGTCITDTRLSCGWCAGTRLSNDPSQVTSVCIAQQNGGPGGHACLRFHTTTCPLCSAQASCGACVADEDCGWCGSNRGTGSGCTEGDATSPYVPQRPGLCDDWSYSNCAADCQSFNNQASCAQCVSEPGCGWCTNGQFRGGYCTNANYIDQCWTWNMGDCTPRCGTNLNCASCTANVSCGWCTDTKPVGQLAVLDGPIDAGQGVTCVEGNSAGPNNPQQCSQDAWLWSPQACAEACASRGTCGDCTKMLGCGWCATTGSCLAGGPINPPCDIADWYYSKQRVCPVPDDCGTKTSCEDCSAMRGCGWCITDQKCYSGFKTGPTAPNTCTQWIFTSCTETKSGMNPWIAVAITASAMLVPFLFAIFCVYRWYINKHGYSPLDG